MAKKTVKKKSDSKESSSKKRLKEDRKSSEEPTSDSENIEIGDLDSDIAFDEPEESETDFTGFRDEE